MGLPAAAAPQSGNHPIHAGSRGGRSYDGGCLPRPSSSLARACGQLISVGFEGTEAPDYLLRWIADGEVGSVMLFRPNIVSPAQVAALVGALRRASPPDAPNSPNVRLPI